MPNSWQPNHQPVTTMIHEANKLHQEYIKSTSSSLSHQSEIPSSQAKCHQNQASKSIEIQNASSKIHRNVMKTSIEKSQTHRTSNIIPTKTRKKPMKNLQQQPFVTQQVKLVLHAPRSAARQGLHQAPLGRGGPAAGALLVAVGGPPPTAFLWSNWLGF